MRSDKAGRVSAGPASGEKPDVARRMFFAAWAWLLAAALGGVFLRWCFVVPTEGIVYGNWLHAHSHVALLGWGGSALWALAMRFFVAADDERPATRWFVVSQVAVAGMAVTFPIQGYARESIAFSALHMACFIWLAVRLWRGNRASREARPFLNAGLFCLLLSCLGPLALGPLAAAGWKHSSWYTLAVYFYVHFQGNGWLVFMPAAALLQFPGARDGGRLRIGYRQTGCARASAWLLASGCVLTFAVSALWMKPPAWVWGIAVAGGALQLAGCFVGGRLISALNMEIVRGAGGGVLARRLLAIAGGAFVLKCVLQLIAVVPALADLAHGSRNMPIAFLHLVFLGVASMAILALALACGWLPPKPRIRAGSWIWVGGIGLSETAIVWQALAGAWAFWPVLPGGYALMLGAALVLAAGVGLLRP